MHIVEIDLQRVWNVSTDIERGVTVSFVLTLIYDDHYTELGSGKIFLILLITKLTIHGTSFFYHR